LQRMVTPHPSLEIDVAEQLARSIVAAAHASFPNLVGANESRSLVGGEHVFQLPARGVPRTKTFEDERYARELYWDWSNHPLR
jgi:hypothetical protein